MKPRELLPRYDFNCAKCGHGMEFEPSISMEMGLNSGHGRCSKCNTFLHLSIDFDTQTGRSQVFDEYLKERKKEKVTQ